MKTITGLENRMKHFSDDPKLAMEEMPTLRRMLLNLLGAARTASGEESLSLWDIGLKIRREEKSEITLEDAEFKLIKQKIDENGIGWVAHYHAQMLLCIREAEKASAAA
jgi:hypothetical protein